jgi:hypothetical protein
MMYAVSSYVDVILNPAVACYRIHRNGICWMDYCHYHYRVAYLVEIQGLIKPFVFNFCRISHFYHFFLVRVPVCFYLLKKFKNAIFDGGKADKTKQ